MLGLGEMNDLMTEAGKRREKERQMVIEMLDRPAEHQLCAWEQVLVADLYMFLVLLPPVSVNML